MKLPRSFRPAVTIPATLLIKGYGPPSAWRPPEAFVQGIELASPILQNGKLIGAVTHVLVNDPTSGYGILAEHMLAESGLQTGTKAS